MLLLVLIVALHGLCALVVVMSLMILHVLHALEVVVILVGFVADCFLVVCCDQQLQWSVLFGPSGVGSPGSFTSFFSFFKFSSCCGGLSVVSMGDGVLAFVGFVLLVIGTSSSSVTKFVVALAVTSPLLILFGFCLLFERMRGLKHAWNL